MVCRGMSRYVVICRVGRGMCVCGLCSRVERAVLCGSAEDGVCCSTVSVGNAARREQGPGWLPDVICAALCCEMHVMAMVVVVVMMLVLMVFTSPLGLRHSCAIWLPVSETGQRLAEDSGRRAPVRLCLRGCAGRPGRVRESRACPVTNCPGRTISGIMPADKQTNKPPLATDSKDAAEHWVAGVCSAYQLVSPTRLDRNVDDTFPDSWAPRRAQQRWQDGDASR